MCENNTKKRHFRRKSAKILTEIKNLSVPSGLRSTKRPLEGTVDG